jgi:hypothetical protein
VSRGKSAKQKQVIEGRARHRASAERADRSNGACGHLAELDGLGVHEVVGDDLAHLREVPAVPLTHAHGVGVEFLVELVEERDGLDDHDVHLVGAELELVTRHAVRQTELHRTDVTLGHPSQQ